jgi:inorganic triphosphatase YgiF
MLTEFELKLEVPAEGVEGVARALGRGKTTRQLLKSVYFDTQDEALGRHGITLRLRKDGRRWVQTAKAPGDSPVHRLEHNVPVRAPRGAAAPGIDWRLHGGTPAGDFIAKVLQRKPTDDALPLRAVYQTQVERLARIVSFKGATVEIALDRGRVSAGDEWQAIHEVEFELKKGPPGPAIELARRWCAKHGGWLSTVSKGSKGRRLVQHQQFGPALVASHFTAPAQPGPVFGRAVLHACLEQVLANASDVGCGCLDAEHVHQLRVGVRRLRTARRELRELLPFADPDWEAPWVQLFRNLGRHRDHHFLAGLQSRLEAAGGPALMIEAAAPPDPVAAVRSPAFQDALLHVLGVLHGPGLDAGKDADQVTALLRKRLSKLHKAVLADGQHFDRLPEVRQHRVRKRLKRLRYLAEFAQDFFPRERTGKFIAGLKPVQDALGNYNDELIALRHYQQWAAQEARAWFGAGWLDARRAGNASACTATLRELARLRPFWK